MICFVGTLSLSLSLSLSFWLCFSAHKHEIKEAAAACDPIQAWGRLSPFGQ